MILGTVVGVAQTNLKRMLAYSSIAHGGYLLVGLVAANEVGKAAILFYLLAYSVTNLAAFGVIALLGSRERANDELRDYAGLWHTHPALAALMTVCLLSLGGLPPTAGFIGKWYIFSAAVSAGYYWLAIIGVLTSVDLGLLLPARRRDDVHGRARRARRCRPRHRRRHGGAGASSIVAIFYLGILPTQVLNLAGKLDRHDLLGGLRPRLSTCCSTEPTESPACRLQSDVSQLTRPCPIDRRHRPRAHLARSGAEAARGGVQHVLRGPAAASAMGDARARRGHGQAARPHAHHQLRRALPFTTLQSRLRRSRSWDRGLRAREEGRAGSVRAATAGRRGEAEAGTARGSRGARRPPSQIR